MRGFIIVLGVAAVIMPRCANGQDIYGAGQVVVDHFRQKSDTIEYAWGNNFGLGLRFENQTSTTTRIFGSLDVMPIHSGPAPFYFALTAGGKYGFRGESSGPWPYFGAAAGCVFYRTQAQTAGGQCSYAALVGIMRANEYRSQPYVELQYFISGALKRMALTVGVYTH